MILELTGIRIYDKEQRRIDGRIYECFFKEKCNPSGYILHNFDENNYKKNDPKEYQFLLERSLPLSYIFIPMNYLEKFAWHNHSYKEKYSHFQRILALIIYIFADYKNPHGGLIYPQIRNKLYSIKWHIEEYRWRFRKRFLKEFRTKKSESEFDEYASYMSSPYAKIKPQQTA